MPVGDFATAIPTAGVNSVRPEPSTNYSSSSMVVVHGVAAVKVIGKKIGPKTLYEEWVWLVSVPYCIAFPP